MGRSSPSTTIGCSFEGCDFTDARLNGSGHRSPSFIDCSFKGGSLFSGEFEDGRLVGASLEEADLTAITISGGDLSYASLFSKEDLKGQDLRGVPLVGAELAGCDLTGANLSRARLRGADLSVLIFTEVKLDVGQAIQVARSLGVETSRGDPSRSVGGKLSRTAARGLLT